MDEGNGRAEVEVQEGPPVGGEVFLLGERADVAGWCDVEQNVDWPEIFLYQLNDPLRRLRKK